MDDLLGHLVVSMAGRDKGCICAIVGDADEDGYVFIADGKVRKVEKPKKKSPLWLKIVGGVFSALVLFVLGFLP